MTIFLNTLDNLFAGNELTKREIFLALNEIAIGKVNDFQIVSFLSALKTKGETEKELSLFANAVKSKSLKINRIYDNLVDTAGTGGDRKNTFNISTCSAFVASGAGALIAKHGNRAVSGSTGSADVLEELKVSIQSDPLVIEKQLEKIGIAFLFAPYFHPAFKRVSMVRKELGFKTIFNLLGPLTNPAGAKRQLIGAYDENAAEKMAYALQLLGTEKSFVVTSDIDEISISGKTTVFDVSERNVKKFSISPADFGFKFSNIKKIQVKNVKESAKKISSVLDGKHGAERDIVLLNAGAAIFVSGIANSFSQGISLAEKSIDSGKALEKLQGLRDF